MKKKLVAVLLSLALVVGGLTACGSTKVPEADAEVEVEAEAEAEAEPEVESEVEPEAADEVYPGGGDFKPGDEIPVDYFAGTEISIVWEKRATDEASDYNAEKLAIIAAEEATGIHVNWILMESGTRGDKMPTILAGEDRPDVYLQTVTANDISANPELFYDLSEEGLLETYAPKVVEDFNTFSGTWDAITWSDGSIYSLATGWSVSPNDAAGGIFVINQDWLNKVGMELPTTGEEFLDVLRAFRDEDVDGDGDPSNEIPYGFSNKTWAGNIMQLADYFGLGSGPNCDATQYYLQIKDGKVVSTLDTDKYRTFVEFVHTMVEENLIDVEGFSQNSDQFNAKISAGTYGVYSCWTPPQDQMAHYVPLGIWRGIEGVDPIITGYGASGSTMNNVSLVIDAETEHIDAILHWWNWLSQSTETKLTMRSGQQGISWDFNSDGSVYIVTDHDKGPNYGYTVGFHNACPLLLPNEVYVMQEGVTDPTNSTLYRENMVAAIIDYAVKEPVPKRLAPAEALEEKAFLETDLFAYCGNFNDSNCMDGITDAEWEAHLQALEDNGYYEWLEWYQKYVDNAF